jgi:hypothetical protein
MCPAGADSAAAGTAGRTATGEARPLDTPVSYGRHSPDKVRDRATELSGWTPGELPGWTPGELPGQLAGWPPGPQTGADQPPASA